MAGIIQFHKLRMGYTSSAPTVTSTKSLIEVSNEQDFFWPTDDNFVFVANSDANYAQLVRYAICSQNGKFSNIFCQGDQAYLCCEFLLKESIDVPIITVFITNKFNVSVYGKATCHHRISVPNQVAHGSYIRFCRHITFNIAPDEYVLSFALTTMQQSHYAYLDELPQAEFVNHLKICDVYEKVGVFYVTPPYSLSDRSHWGICNLPGDCQVQVLANSEPGSVS